MKPFHAVVLSMAVLTGHNSLAQQPTLNLLLDDLQEALTSTDHEYVSFDSATKLLTTKKKYKDSDETYIYDICTARNFFWNLDLHYFPDSGVVRAGLRLDSESLYCSKSDVGCRFLFPFSWIHAVPTETKNGWLMTPSDREIAIAQILKTRNLPKQLKTSLEGLRAKLCK